MPDRCNEISERLFKSMHSINKNYVVKARFPRNPELIAGLGKEPDARRSEGHGVKLKVGIDAVLEAGLDIEECLAFVHPNFQIPICIVQG
jgi:hypothetical protein